LDGQNPSIAICAHPACIGSDVAVADGFVILSWLERERRFPVAQSDEAGFLAREKLFDHHAWSKRSHGGLGLGAVLGWDHSFTCGQPIRLHHHRIIETLQSLDSFLLASGAEKTGRRNPQPLHEFFCMNLAAFEARIVPRWTHNWHAGSAKLIDNSGHQ